MSHTVNRVAPRLSIGLPVYNGEAFLSQTLDHLLAQTFRDFEIIISDNASTDGTAQICREFANQDARIRYLRNDRNLGSVANFNRAFALSAAPLFKWAAHDDLHHRDYLEACVRLLDADDNTVLAHTGTAFIGEDGKTFPFDADSGTYTDPKTGVRQTPDSPAIGDSPIAAARFWQVLSHARWGSHMFGVIRREALLRTHLQHDFAGGDRAMLAELALVGRFRAVPERLFLKRFHAGVSWALNQRELRSFLSPDGKAYWRRARQIRAYFTAPAGKPVGVATTAACTALVAIHCLKTAAHALARKDARNAQQGKVWRDTTHGSAGTASAPRTVARESKDSRLGRHAEVRR
ncbi:MAG: glycosyltransferase family 2 protein [Proteobacteria bacterium]|nr:glycosyltransferase family 2 protein [Pseudomonadota bacterium]